MFFEKTYFYKMSNGLFCVFFYFENMFILIFVSIIFWDINTREFWIFLFDIYKKKVKTYCFIV